MSNGLDGDLPSNGVSKGEQSEEDPPKPQRDASKFTLVEAAQYGILDRCIELVERQGANVCSGDEENITVLHWAAINNRLEIARYAIYVVYPRYESCRGDA